MQSAHTVLYYHVFRVCLRHIFSHNLLKEKNFLEEAIEHKMPFLIFYTYSFRKSDVLNSVCLFVKYLLFVSRISRIRIFSTVL
jgi:hypothetical protein